MSKKRGELAPPVEVPRWICFFGTQLVVVPARNEHDARALVRDALRERRVKHEWWEVRVRQLRVEDLERVTKWEEAFAIAQVGRSRPKPLHQGSSGRVA